MVVVITRERYFEGRGRGEEREKKKNVDSEGSGVDDDRWLR